MHYILVLCFFVLIASQSQAQIAVYAADAPSDLPHSPVCTEPCTVIHGAKHPEEGNRQPVYTMMSQLNFEQPAGAVRSGVSLAHYALPAPDQEDGGTCLYMATTGAAEIILNQSVGRLPISEGEGDLSERFLINASKHLPMTNWRTDTITAFNKVGGGLLNREYPYTKGWYVRTSGGQIAAAMPGQSHAAYGTEFNWVNELTDYNYGNLVPLPKFERTVLHQSDSLWDTTTMSESTIDAIKYQLQVMQRPVLVIYNHFAYWHATLIIGFDDSMDTGDCPFVREWIRYMAEKRFAYRNVEDAVNVEGCRQRGAFLVRDSIYSSELEPLYDYNEQDFGEERPYSRKVVYHSYDWLKFLGNHAYAILGN